MGNRDLGLSSKDGAWEYLWLLAGLVSFGFIAMRWNAMFAAWISLPCLLRFFRYHRGVPGLAAGYALLLVPSYLKLSGTWASVVGVGIELLASFFLCFVPIAVPLALDRLFNGKVRPFVGSLVFPASYVALDFALVAIVGQGTLGTLSVSQIAFKELQQASSFMGTWGVSFLILWFASAVVPFLSRGVSTRERRASLIALSAFFGVLLYGGARLAFAPPGSSTVKIAGITVPMSSSAWDDTIGKGCPAGDAPSLELEFAPIADALFERSAAAASGGAKVIFWAEGNCFAYEDHVEGIMARASEFAKDHSVYFAPSIQALHYGSSINDSRSVMFTPTGDAAYIYRKHVSKYETNSDGIIKHVDTPYGRIGSAICFDMDIPAYVRQVGAMGIDIMLVPAYDTKAGSPYHSYPAVLRGIENGMSVFRLVNEGTSIAADFQGRELATLDFFESPDGLLYADLPTKGVVTLYRILGDWPPYLCAAFILGLFAWLLLGKFGVAKRGAPEGKIREER